MIRSLWLVTGSLQGGGAERQIVQMANYWAAKGLSVTLATWSGPDVEDVYRPDRKVRRVHMDVQLRGGLFPRIRLHSRRVAKLRSLLLSARPDAVLSFIAVSNVLTLLASARLKLRVVVSERSQPVRDLTVPLVWRLLRKLTYGWSDEVVVQTRAAARWVERHCGRRATVIPNAIRTLPEPAASREPLIVAIGRLSHEKGFDLLLHAFARIANDFGQWRVAIIGDGVERSNLQLLRNELRLEERVEFIGYVHDIENWLARAALVVQPSRFEGFPNVVLEGMGMGAAVVSSDCESGPGELIVDGLNGRLVPVEDAAALSAAMADLMAHPDLREGLGRAALQVRERFRIEHIMRRWEMSLDPGAGPGSEA
jgi:GalNAc-alpha-(1->4)-GalNAc-alpha-(1->3)-diNAcBac-PP-undecaprenol alpha-1,4-N-acetyl-D-galactosaminyltransferase